MPEEGTIKPDKATLASIIADNTAERRRLQAMAERLTEADLQRDLGWGWTVAVGLAHLAFFDRRALIVLQRWDGKGVSPPEGDVDILNDALVAEWRALPPKLVVSLALEAAAAVDAFVEHIGEAKAAGIMAGGEDWLLRRDRHRREHLDQVERVLGKPSRGH